MKKRLILSILTILFLIVLIAYYPAVRELTGKATLGDDCPSNMIAYWQFDENSGDIANDVKKRYNVQINNPSWQVGARSSSLEIGETECVMEVPALSKENFPQEAGTIEMWIYSDSFGPDRMNIFDEQTKDKKNIFIKTSKTDYNLQVAFSSSMMDAFTVNFLTNLEKKQWNHLVITWENIEEHKAKIYVNGKLEMTEVLPDSWMPSEQDFIIGKQSTIPRDGTVKIDELAIYDRPLEETKIKDHYHLGQAIDYCMGDCHYSWWFDNANVKCQYKKFCGTYNYADLKEFKTEETCLESLTKNEIEVNGCSLLDKEVILRMNQVKESFDKNITLKEGKKISYENYFVLPSKILKLTNIYNTTTGPDEIEFEDLITNEKSTLQITEEGKGIIVLNTGTYDVRYSGSSDVPLSSRYIEIDFPQTSGHEKMVFDDC